MSTDELMINVEEDEADNKLSESGDVDDASASKDKEASPPPPPKAKRAEKMVKGAAVTAKTPAQKFTIVVPPRPRKGAVDTTKTPKAKGAAKKAISFDENPFEQLSQSSATLIAGSQVSNFETDNEESFPLSPIKKPAKCSTATKLKAVTKACGIDKKLCDALLKDTIKGLPNISWQTGYSDSEEKGMALFTSMSEQMDNFDIDYVKELLVFAGNKELGVVNLSQAHPSNFNLKKAPGANSNPRYTFITYKGDDQPALCLSLILAIDDYSQEMQINIRNVHSKWIAGCPLTYKDERLVAAIAIIIGNTSFKLQVANGKLTYSTRPKRIKDGQVLNKKVPSNKLTMLTSKKSPATADAQASKGGAFRYALNADDNIPVYDGRDITLDLPDDIRKIPSALPTYGGKKLPTQSLLLMAYTTCVYKQKENDPKQSVAFNALWAVLLNTPATAQE
ncbi:hypothetical protein CPB83DRAFT_900495 [Crepidotus variabilis]|uniref:Uncharacterized protein n=1 Tax=Crepidotus variabilis TaxID=179855 RepID=A0A9P6JHZ1_9AGAR|nr:hypothetical protein CPB83DRAFT_900495 [Crepidotus variabilis]